MSEEKELKLACLHQAGGDLDHAQRLFDWVSGSVRATPDSEAAEVSAPKQDKPQQSFNYRHPSKYGTDVPRRCYLEELTPEERAIRDLVDTVERLGAHPLLTATVIQLMKAGEDLADWVDIGLRDKAIAALSPGNDLGLLDDGQQETSPVQSAIDQDKALQSKLDQFLQQPFALLWGGGVVAPPGLDPHHLVEVVTRGNVLRTRAVKDFQWLSGHAPTNPEDDIIAYRPLATWDEVIQHHVHAHKYEPKPGDLDRAAAHLDDDPLAATMLQEAMDSGHADGPRITGAERSEDESQASSTEAVIPEGFTKWEPFISVPPKGDLVVEGLFEDGSTELNSFDVWNRQPQTERGLLVAYRLIEATAEAERTGVDSPPTEQDRVEPAAFAPVNAIEDPDTDALMWANGFEADATARGQGYYDAKAAAERANGEARIGLGSLWGRKPKVNA